MKIYLDYAATTPIRDEVIKAMEPYLGHFFGNPSSIHSFGRQAKFAVDQARKKIADILGCEEGEIYFTSGGTESDNLAISGLIETYNFIPHIIVSSIEHAAVLKNCKKIESEGKAKVTYLPVSKEGVVNLEDLSRAIRPETVLVSMMYVNNEIGTVQPIKEIGKFLQELNPARENKIYFHTDAVQASEYFSLLVKKLNVDMLSLSGHKIYGPKGIGILFARRGVPLTALITGGPQELGLRAGTENVAGIVGMAKALELATIERYENSVEKVEKMRDQFESAVVSKIPEVRILGKRGKRSPAITSLVFPYIDGGIVLMNLDLEGIAASSGSACASGALEESHVLKALSLKSPYNGGAVRFSLGRKTSKEELGKTAEILVRIIKRLNK